MNILTAPFPSTTKDAAAGSRSERWVLGFIFLVYALLVITLTCRHEIWRDEARPLNIVLESRSLLDLFRNMHNEGHPGLWYLVLYVGHAILGTKAVLRFANLSVVLAAAWVFLFRSPFTTLEKTLFVFGCYPLYEYGVKSPNYAIGMFLLFVACAIYPDRHARFLTFASVLFLLANTSPCACILTGAIFAGLVVESMFFTPPGLPKSTATSVGGFVLIAAGIIFSVVQSYPDRSTIVTPFHSLRIGDFLAAIPKSMLSQGSFAAAAFWQYGPFPVAVVVLLLYVYLFRKPSLVVMLLVAVTGLDLLQRLILAISSRHRGFVWLAMITVLWMDASTGVQLRWKYAWSNGFRSLARRVREVGLPVLLAIEIVRGVPPVWADFRGEYSSSKRAAEYIKRSVELRRAVIVAEPDYMCESLEYYLDNPIFIPRERKFGGVISFTTANKQELTLDELLQGARYASRKTGRPALIVLGHPLIVGTRSFSYSKRFLVDEEALGAFRKETRWLGDFSRARMSDENYALYLLPYAGVD